MPHGDAGFDSDDVSPLAAIRLIVAAGDQAGQQDATQQQVTTAHSPMAPASESPLRDFMLGLAGCSHGAPRRLPAGPERDLMAPTTTPSLSPRWGASWHGRLWWLPMTHRCHSLADER
ncbi:MAG: hypothetical protein DRI90_00240 [Deltaproteobacteria bacterium]|nr:MAG: hypothetical protein DRI90_00240 [Deltaproteobacteria bacterium]